MNEGQYTNIRSYLEDIASTQRQMLALMQQQVAAKPAPFVGTLETEPPPAAVTKEPISGYDAMTVQEVLDSLRGSNVATRERVMAYERKNKARSGVIQPLVNWNS